MTLEELGWNPFFAEAYVAFAGQGLSPARVAIQHKGAYELYSEFGELRGEVTGKIHYLARGPEDYPAVGDWVVIHARPEEGGATILEMLPRKTKFSRRAPGPKAEEQIVAANIDTVFLVSGLDGNFNIRRMERYLVLAKESGATPVIVLNKADIAKDLDLKVKETDRIAGGTPIVLMSATLDEGLDAMRGYLQPGITGALLGSSGVGKSTIINHLLGVEYFKTMAVRESDARGRHATTHRELVPIPTGGLLIDTPGMRELQLWSGPDAFRETFEDIETLVSTCRFRDCTHEKEPGCSIRKALEDGTLDAGRYKSYKKLLKEIAYQNRKDDKVAQLLEKERWKKLTSQQKRGYKKS
ncbi:MAG TPA: ribosome small subunit-dependent GTPase A [Bacteroidota bacterium]|nr:ribosome small subunit-dependent GTPase A [Bacteroidota bacterium]